MADIRIFDLTGTYERLHVHARLDAPADRHAGALGVCDNGDERAGFGIELDGQSRCADLRRDGRHGRRHADRPRRRRQAPESRLQLERADVAHDRLERLARRRAQQLGLADHAGRPPGRTCSRPRPRARRARSCAARESRTSRSISTSAASTEPYAAVATKHASTSPIARSGVVKLDHRRARWCCGSRRTRECRPSTSVSGSRRASVNVCSVAGLARSRSRRFGSIESGSSKFSSVIALADAVADLVARHAAGDAVVAGRDERHRSPCCSWTSSTLDLAPACRARASSSSGRDVTRTRIHRRCRRRRARTARRRSPARSS